MQVGGRGQAQGTLQQDLARGVVGQVFAAHHIGDALVGVVHHHGELVGPEPIGPAQDEITHRLFHVLLLQTQAAVLPLQEMICYDFCSYWRFAIKRHGLFFPIAHAPDVALGGFLLQGGFGWGSRELGLATQSVIGLDLMLVNKASGQAWPATRELAYYHGSDGGESWSEGSRNDEVVFLDIPPGTYYVTVDPDIAPEKPVPVRDVIEVYSGGAGWSNFVMVMLFLIIFPFFTFMRRAAFETGRWAESDHAPAGSSDSAEDDD